MLTKDSRAGNTSRNSSLRSLVQNYMLHTTFFFRDAWIGLMSLMKLEALLFHSTTFSIVSNYDNVFMISSMAPLQHYKHICSSICRSTKWVDHILQSQFPLIKVHSFLIPVAERHKSHAVWYFVLWLAAALQGGNLFFLI